jgi:hypothetical protein
MPTNRPQNSGLMQTMINDKSMSDKLLQTIQSTNANVVFRSIHAPPVPIYSGFFVQNDSASSRYNATLQTLVKWLFGFVCLFCCCCCCFCWFFFFGVHIFDELLLILFLFLC